jgi:hypothetical protein
VAVRCVASLLVGAIGVGYVLQIKVGACSFHGGLQDVSC